jgi:hypothetical protein
MRTPDSIREAAERHFSALVEYAEPQGKEVFDEARADKELGMRIVDAALALPAGELLNLNEVVGPEESGKSAFAKAMRVLPYLMGALRLLDMEFVNPSTGVVPYALVSRMFRGEETVVYEGLELTAKTVFVQYRRRALT